MGTVRIIARLDIKGHNLIKGVQMEGLRKLGDPNLFAQHYYEEGIDEIIYMDCVASLYERASLLEIVRRTTERVFIPITVGGGIRSIEDAREVLLAGADKVAINTAAVKRPGLIAEMSERFGAQCMVLSIEAKQTALGVWEAYIDSGRERTGRDAVEWAVRGVELGAGEILLTSVDCDGTRKGFDCALVSKIARKVPVPVIASGGMGTLEDFISVVSEGSANAVAIGSALHYGHVHIPSVRNRALNAGIPVRRVEWSRE